MPVDVQLLQAWLDLPNGPWPPPPHTLLGVPATADGAEAERRALKLMSTLRPHQLLHPELVTEGMNRLAQAMLGFARAVPPVASSGVGTGAVASFSFEIAPSTASSQLKFDVPPLRPTPLVPLVLDAEIVELKRPPMPRPRFTHAEPSDEHRFRATVAIPELEARTTAFEGVRADRRTALRELRALLRLKSAWEKLGPFAGAPAEAAATPGRQYALLEACAEFRAAWGTLGVAALTWREACPRIRAVFERPDAASVFRMLAPEQRRRLADDWARGRAEMTAEVDARRIQFRRRRSHGSLRAKVVWIGGRVLQPEGMLLLPLGILLAIAFLRS